MFSWTFFPMAWGLRFGRAQHMLFLFFLVCLPAAALAFDAFPVIPDCNDWKTEKQCLADCGCGWCNTTTTTGCYGFVHGPPCDHYVTRSRSKHCNAEIRMGWILGITVGLPLLCCYCCVFMLAAFVGPAVVAKRRRDRPDEGFPLL